METESGDDRKKFERFAPQTDYARLPSDPGKAGYAGTGHFSDAPRWGKRRKRYAVLPAVIPRHVMRPVSRR